MDNITDLTDLSLSKLWEIVKDRESWRAAVHGAAKSRTRLSDRTTIYLWQALKIILFQIIPELENQVFIFCFSGFISDLGSLKEVLTQMCSFQAEKDHLSKVLLEKVPVQGKLQGERETVS